MAAHDKVVTVYISSVPGSQAILKNTRSAIQILASRGYKVEEKDVASDEASKTFMIENSGKRVTPQIFVHGAYKGVGSLWVLFD
jgi:glutaredoxin